MSNEPEDYKKNFAMIIPLEAFEVPEMVEDPRGAPIYRGCKAELCACTGRCKDVIAWSQDPDILAHHREYIKQYNENRNKPNPLFRYDAFSEENPDGFFTWEFKIDKP